MVVVVIAAVEQLLLVLMVVFCIQGVVVALVVVVAFIIIVNFILILVLAFVFAVVVDLIVVCLTTRLLLCHGSRPKYSDLERPLPHITPQWALRTRKHSFLAFAFSSVTVCLFSSKFSSMNRDLPSHMYPICLIFSYEEAHSVFLDQIRLMLSMRRRGGGSGGGNSTGGGGTGSSGAPLAVNPDAIRSNPAAPASRRRDRDRRHGDGLL